MFTMYLPSTPPPSTPLTNPYQDPTDPLSHIFAYLALVPQFLLVVYATLLISTREVEILLTLAGQLACEALNWTLKRHYREARPDRMRELHGGYGMPSSHAQFLGFWAATVVLFVWGRRRRGAGGEGSEVLKLQMRFRGLVDGGISLAAVGSVVVMAWSRVYLHYHTTKQVVVGSAAGVGFAVVWFVVVEVVRRLGLVDWLLRSEVARWGRMRDLMCDEDLVEMGWQIYEQKKRRAEEAQATRDRKKR